MNEITVNWVEGSTKEQQEQLPRIAAQLRALISTLKRTPPGTRAFGLSGAYLDYPLAEAVNTFAVELQEAVDEFIPAIEIAEVKPIYDERGRVLYQILIDWQE